MSQCVGVFLLHSKVIQDNNSSTTRVTYHLSRYWNDGEPNDLGDEDCAALYAIENFFKAWNDAKCAFPMKWICEKAPTLTE